MNNQTVPFFRNRLLLKLKTLKPWYNKLNAQHRKISTFSGQLEPSFSGFQTAQDSPFASPFNISRLVGSNFLSSPLNTKANTFNIRDPRRKRMSESTGQTSSNSFPTLKIVDRTTKQSKTLTRLLKRHHKLKETKILTLSLSLPNAPVRKHFRAYPRPFWENYKLYNKFLTKRMAILNDSSRQNRQIPRVIPISLSQAVGVQSNPNLPVFKKTSVGAIHSVIQSFSDSVFLPGGVKNRLQQKGLDTTPMRSFVSSAIPLVLDSRSPSGQKQQARKIKKNVFMHFTSLPSFGGVESMGQPWLSDPAMSETSKLMNLKTLPSSKPNGVLSSSFAGIKKEQPFLKKGGWWSSFLKKGELSKNKPLTEVQKIYYKKRDLTEDTGINQASFSIPTLQQNYMIKSNYSLLWSLKKTNITFQNAASNKYNIWLFPKTRIDTIRKKHAKAKATIRKIKNKVSNQGIQVLLNLRTKARTQLDFASNLTDINTKNTKMWKFPLFSIHKKLTNLYNKNYFLTDNSNSSLASAPIRAVDVIQSHMPKNLSGEFLLPEPLLLKKSRRLVSPTRRNGTYKCTQNHFLSSSNTRGSFYQNWILPTLSNPLKSNSNLCQKQCNQINRLVNLIPNKLMKIIPGSIEVKSIFNSQFSQMSSPPYGVAYADKTRDTRMTGVFNNRVSLPNCFEINPLLYSYAMFIFFNLYFFLFVIKLAPVRLFFKLLFILSVSILRGITIIQTLGWAYSSKVLEYGKKLGVMQSFSNSVFLLPQKVSLKNRLPLWGLESSAMSVLKRRALQTDLFVAGQRLQGSNFNFQSTLDLRKQKTTDKPNQSPLLNRHLRLKGNLVPAILRIPFTAGLVSDSASGAFLTASFAGIKKTKPRGALFNWRSFDRPNKLMKPGLMPSLPQPFVTSFLFQEKSQSLPNRESRAFSLMQGNQPLLFMLKSNSATNSYSSHSSKNAANTFGNTFSALWKLEKIYFQKSLASFSIKIIDKGLFLLSPIKQFYDRPYAYIYDLIATTFGLVEYTANLNNRIPQKLFVNFFSFLKKMSHAIMLYPQELSLSKDFLGFDLGSSNTLSTFGEFPRLDSGFKTPLAFNDGPQSVSSILLRAASKNEAPTRLSFFSAFFSSFLSINMRIFIQKRLQNLIYKIVEELNQPDSELILNQQSYIAALNILTKVSISRNQNIDSLDFNHLITTLDESTAESNKKPQSKISNPVVSKNKIFRFLPFSQIKEGGIPAKNETMLTTKHPSWKVDKFMFSDKPLLHSLKQKTLFELQRAPSAYIGSFNNSIIFSNVKSSIESCRKKKSSSQWYLDQRISFLMNSTIFSTSLVDYHIPKNLTILSSLPANQNVTQKFELLNSLRGFFESTSSLSPELFPNLSLGGCFADEDLRFWSSPPLSKTKKVGLGADSDLQNGPIEFFDPNPSQKASDSIQTGINSVAKLLFSRRLFNSALRLKKKMQLLSPEIYGGLTGLIDLGYSLSIQNQEPVPGYAASVRRLASWSGFSLLAQRSNETTRVDSGQTMARIQANSFVQSTTNNGLITCSAYTSLTPENLYPANAYQRPESINKNVNTGFLGGVTLSNIMCEVFSGLFEKQTAKNVLVIGPPELGKRLLIQAIAGETELKMISDDAAKYSSIEAGVATGVKLLRGIFESLPLYTPCLFLLEDIHLIGERRSDMLSSSQSRCDKHSLSLPLDLQQERDDVEHQEKLTASFNEINIHSRTKKGQETKDSSLNEYLSYCFNLFFSASRYNVNLKKAAPPFGTYLSSRPLPLALSMAWPLSQLGSQSSVLSQQLRMEPSNSRGSKLGDNNLSSNSLKGNSDLVSSLLRPRVLVDLVNLPEQFLDFSQRKKHYRLDSKYYPISPLNAKLTRFLPEYHTLYLFPRKIKEITTAKLCAPGSINTIKKSSQINSFFYTVIKETPIIQLSRLHFVNSQNNSGNIAEFNNNQAGRTNSQYLKKQNNFFKIFLGLRCQSPIFSTVPVPFLIPVRRNKGAVKDKKQNSTATAHKMEKSIPESRMKIVKTSNHSSVYLQDNLDISTIQNGRSDLHKTSSLLHSRKSFEFSQQSKNPSLPAIMEIQRASILRPELMGQSTSKILQLANLALGQLNAKVDMITDLLMIIDNVRTSRGFIVFATTHIPYILDPALRRPGRLDETIYIPQFSSFAGKASEPSNKISLMLCSSYPLRDARKAPSVADGGLAPQFILRGQSLETPSIIGSGGLLIGGVANKNGATAKTTEPENKLSTKSNSTRATDIFLHTTKTRLIPSFRPANLKKASIQSSRQNKTLFLMFWIFLWTILLILWQDGSPKKANGSPFLLLGSTPGSFSIRTQGDANLLARIPDSPQVWRSTPKERTPLLDSIQSSGGYSLGSSRSSIPKRHKNSQHNKTVGKLTYVTTLERSKNTDQKPDYCNHHSFCFIFNMTDPGTVATTNPDLITLQNQNLNKKDRGLTKNLIKSSSSIQATMDWEKEFRFSKLIKNYLKIKFYIYTKISSILFSSSLYFQVKERSSGSAFIQQHLLGKTQHYFLIPELNIHTTTKQTRNLREGFWSHSTHKALKIVTAHFSALTKNLLNESTSSLIDTDKRFFLFENKNLRINNLKKLQKLKLIVSGGHELGLNLKERLPASALSGNCDSGSGATAPLMPGLKNLGYLTRIMHNHTRNNANLIKTKEFCLCAGIALQNSFTSLLVPEKSDSLVGRSCKIDQINVKLSEYLTKDRTLEPRSGKKRSSPPHFISSVLIPAKKDYQNKKSLPFGTKTGTGGEDGMPTKKNVEAIEKLIRDRHVSSFGYENLTALQDPIAFSDTSILLPFRRYENYKRSEIDNLAFIQNKLSSPELNSIFQKHQNLVEFSKLYVNTKDEPKEPNGMHSYIGSIHSSAFFKKGAAPLGLKTKARNDNNGAYGKGTPFFLSQKLQVNPSNPKLNQTGKGSRPAMPISKQFFSIHRKTFTPLNKTQDSYLLQRNGLYNIQKPFCSSLIRASTKTNNQQRFFYKQQYQSLLTDQWWNGQLSESTLEATFLSDIDWRYNFIAKLSVDLIIDFPTTEQYYNPRDRNWVHKSSISYWDKKKLNYLSNKLDQSKISDKTNIVGTRPVAILPFRTKTGTKGAKVLSKRLEIPLNPKIKKGDISHYNFIYSIPNLRGFELIPAKGKSFTSAKCQFPPLQVPETSKQLYPLSFRPILEHSIPSYNSVKLIDLNREKLDFMTFCFLISKT
uniref:Cell division protein n=1 Tax=Staurocarteria cerasiformis TaxID=69401 RepID=A0A0S2LQA4_STACE|nr:cell division protein [Carteria cerasiformis]ALO63418.1 cell division protein [Carteria cerasiformis]